LDPPRQVILVRSDPGVSQDAIQQDPSAMVTIQAIGEQTYRLSYKAKTSSVLRVGLPYFPGWEATVDGNRCAIFRADHAMTAIIVPPGDKELDLRFRSTYFRIGALLSGCGVLLLIGFAVIGRKGMLH
jgi:uncharacterized membrane protein YfhO